MTETPRKDATLSYAPGEGNRRRRIYRRVIWFSLICGIAFVAAMIAPEAFRRARMVYYQHCVLNATPLSDPPYSSEPGLPHVHADGSPAGLGGRLTTTFSDPDWFKFLLASQGNPIRPRSTIYLHGISDRHGNQQIIGVEILPGYEATTPKLNVQLITPGGLFSNPTIAPIIVRPFAFDFDLQAMPDAKLTILSGQPDPADPSHFTIDYDLNGQRHTLDGYLDDQDVLTIQKRREPSTR